MTMQISMIVAMDQNRGIGVDQGLPWHLPDELQHFKHTTMGHHLILGRKTYETLTSSLPGRTIIVLTRNQEYRPQVGKTTVVAHSLSEALRYARDQGDNEVFIGGGADIFEQSLPLTDHLYLTRVHAELEADTYFPPLDFTKWNLLSETHHPPDEKHPYAFTIKHFARNHSAAEKN
jgi:dihydrofolate reductase